MSSFVTTSNISLTRPLPNSNERPRRNSSPAPVAQDQLEKVVPLWPDNPQRGFEMLLDIHMQQAHIGPESPPEDIKKCVNAVKAYIQILYALKNSPFETKDSQPVVRGELIDNLREKYTCLKEALRETLINEQPHNDSKKKVKEEWEAINDNAISFSLYWDAKMDPKIQRRLSRIEQAADRPLHEDIALIKEQFEEVICLINQKHCLDTPLSDEDKAIAERKAKRDINQFKNMRCANIETQIIAILLAFQVDQPLFKNYRETVCSGIIQSLQTYKQKIGIENTTITQEKIKNIIDIIKPDIDIETKEWLVQGILHGLGEAPKSDQDALETALGCLMVDGYKYNKDLEILALEEGNRGVFFQKIIEEQIVWINQQNVKLRPVIMVIEQKIHILYALAKQMHHVATPGSFESSNDETKAREACRATLFAILKKLKNGQETFIDIIKNDPVGIKSRHLEVNTNERHVHARIPSNELIKRLNDIVVGKDLNQASNVMDIFRILDELYQRVFAAQKPKITRRDAEDHIPKFSQGITDLIDGLNIVVNSINTINLSPIDNVIYTKCLEFLEIADSIQCENVSQSFVKDMVSMSDPSKIREWLKKLDWKWVSLYGGLTSEEQSLKKGFFIRETDAMIKAKIIDKKSDEFIKNWGAYVIPISYMKDRDNPIASDESKKGVLKQQGEFIDQPEVVDGMSSQDLDREIRGRDLLAKSFLYELIVQGDVSNRFNNNLILEFFSKIDFQSPPKVKTGLRDAEYLILSRPETKKAIHDLKLRMRRVTDARPTDTYDTFRNRHEKFVNHIQQKKPFVLFRDAIRHNYTKEIRTHLERFALLERCIGLEKDPVTKQTLQIEMETKLRTIFELPESIPSKPKIVSKNLKDLEKIRKNPLEIVMMLRECQTSIAHQIHDIQKTVMPEVFQTIETFISSQQARVTELHNFLYGTIDAKHEGDVIAALNDIAVAQKSQNDHTIRCASLQVIQSLKAAFENGGFELTSTDVRYALEEEFRPMVEGWLQELDYSPQATTTKALFQELIEKLEEGYSLSSLLRPDDRQKIKHCISGIAHKYPNNGVLQLNNPKEYNSLRDLYHSYKAIQYDILSYRKKNATDLTLLLHAAIKLQTLPKDQDQFKRGSETEDELTFAGNIQNGHEARLVFDNIDRVTPSRMNQELKDYTLHKLLKIAEHYFQNQDSEYKKQFEKGTSEEMIREKFRRLFSPFVISLNNQNQEIVKWDTSRWGPENKVTPIHRYYTRWEAITDLPVKSLPFDMHIQAEVTKIKEQVEKAKQSALKKHIRIQQDGTVYGVSKPLLHVLPLLLKLVAFEHQRSRSYITYWGEIGMVKYLAYAIAECFIDQFNGQMRYLKDEHFPVQFPVFPSWAFKQDAEGQKIWTNGFQEIGPLLEELFFNVFNQNGASYENGLVTLSAKEPITYKQNYTIQDAILNHIPLPQSTERQWIKGNPQDMLRVVCGDSANTTTPEPVPQITSWVPKRSKAEIQAIITTHLLRARETDIDELKQTLLDFQNLFKEYQNTLQGQLKQAAQDAENTSQRLYVAIQDSTNLTEEQIDNITIQTEALKRIKTLIPLAVFVQQVSQNLENTVQAKNEEGLLNAHSQRPLFSKLDDSNRKTKELLNILHQHLKRALQVSQNPLKYLGGPLDKEGYETELASYKTHLERVNEAMPKIKWFASLNENVAEQLWWIDILSETQSPSNDPPIQPAQDYDEQKAQIATLSRLGDLLTFFITTQQKLKELLDNILDLSSIDTPQKTLRDLSEILNLLIKKLMDYEDQYLGEIGSVLEKLDQEIVKLGKQISEAEEKPGAPWPQIKILVEEQKTEATKLSTKIKEICNPDSTEKSPNIEDLQNALQSIQTFREDLDTYFIADHLQQEFTQMANRWASRVARDACLDQIRTQINPGILTHLGLNLEQDIISIHISTQGSATNLSVVSDLTQESVFELNIIEEEAPLPSFEDIKTILIPELQEKLRGLAATKIQAAFRRKFRVEA